MAGEAARALLGLLADGNWHSGADLGSELGRSRAAIWKQVKALQALGVPVRSRRGHGYALESPLELLDPAVIRGGLGEPTSTRVADLDVRFRVDSTSARLMDAPPPSPGRFRIMLAEHQTGGRGRRGRRWHSPLGSGLCLSMSWLWESPPRDLACLGLVMGVIAAEAVTALGARQVQLKWPNDVIAAGGKLAGILVDVAGEAAGPLKVVAGIGVNVRPAKALAQAVRQEGGPLLPVALDEVVGDPPVSRNSLAARLVQDLCLAVDAFGRDGFLPYVDRWRRLDWLFGRDIAVAMGSTRVAGKAKGISADGALLLEQGDQVATIMAGDVTLRDLP